MARGHLAKCTEKLVDLPAEPTLNIGFGKYKYFFTAYKQSYCESSYRLETSKFYLYYFTVLGKLLAPMKLHCRVARNRSQSQLLVHRRQAKQRIIEVTGNYRHDGKQTLPTQCQQSHEKRPLAPAN